MDAYRKPDADDRTHERRYKHGAYYDRRGVDVKPQRCYEYGYYKYDYVYAAKRHSFSDSCFGFGLRYEVTVQIEVTEHFCLQLLKIYIFHRLIWMSCLIVICSVRHTMPIYKISNTVRNIRLTHSA